MKTAGARFAGALRPNLPRVIAAAAICLVIAVGAAVAVDVRLDRHWVLRGVALVLALLCAGILVADRGRTVRRAIGFFGVLLWGLVVPASTTSWSTPPEVNFALAAADDAKAAAIKEARSADPATPGEPGSAARLPVFRPRPGGQDPFLLTSSDRASLLAGRRSAASLI